ncbi:MAG: transglutaminase TgpA family protein [Acidimicrobiales bacterium]
MGQERLKARGGARGGWLAAATLVAGLGTGRLFASWSFAPGVVIAAILPHIIAYLGRRRRLPVVMWSAAALAASALACVLVVLPGTTYAGIPTAATWTALHHAISAARVAFDTTVPPAPVLPGYEVAAMAAVSVAAILAEWAAFAEGAVLEALLPAFAITVFTSALAPPRGLALEVAVFVVAAVGYAGASETAASAGARGARALRGVDEDTPVGTSAAARGALVARWPAIAAAGTAGALLLGPLVPGAGGPSLLPLGGRGFGPANRVTVSPLVTIQSSKLHQANVLMFTVRSAVPAYWRLTALDTFNGNLWTSDYSYTAATRRLPSSGAGAVPPAGSKYFRTVRQRIDIAALGSIWLPAAYRPVGFAPVARTGAAALAGAGAVGYNPSSGTLISSRSSVTGMSYEVTSAVPRLNAALLASARAGPAGRYLQLPRLPAKVVDLARQIVAGQHSAYGKALALQSFFRHNFSYNLNVSEGSSTKALVNFLFVTRSGYCQQFAGAYAVLARAVGLPARVAVGFTTGKLVAKDTYAVTGLDAHAWPEVLLAPYGWVSFEPTPGRGEPGTRSYTRTGQVAAAGGAGPNTPLQPAAATSATPLHEHPAGGTAATQGSSVRGRRGRPAGKRVPSGATRTATITGLVVTGLLVTGLLVLRRPAALQRRLRWARLAPRQRPGAAAAVGTAWRRATAALAAAGMRRRPEETPLELARRADRELGLPPPARAALQRLASTYAEAAYSGGGTAVAAGEAATADARALRAALVARLRLVQRVTLRFRGP